MSQITALLHSYHSFINDDIKDRFFKHSDLLRFLEKIETNSLFKIKEAGESFQSRSIKLITCGDGPVKVFLWSQMHGNEATATMALTDLLNFLGTEDRNNLKDIILQNCTLYIIPMVNPDGAEVFNRRNAQEIDINRDFLAQQSPEGNLLRTLRDEIMPHFGFNLHDQTTMWSAGHSGNPATISLLAPAYDEALSVNSIRQVAMQVIAEMNGTLKEIIPGHVGRFDDEFEPRAFGDNFQAAGTSTILIEAGGYADDPEKQHIRKLVFISIIAGLLSISGRTFLNKKVDDYFAIPENKLHHFQILLRNCKVQCGKRKWESEKPEAESTEPDELNYRVDIGLIVKETINEGLRSVTQTYLLGDIGDLSNRFGYRELDCGLFTLIQTKRLRFEEAADLVLMDGLEVILAIENGILTSDTDS
ncbi:MAG: M14 metallopeptidase family protein [Daejeonella sp.]